jgi:hypothetical protein
VKRDIYIKVNTSLCPKKLLKALLKEKALFPTKVPAGRPFFGNKGPKKNQATFHFHYLCYLCNKIRVYRKWKCYSSYRIFSIIFDFIAQTDLFNSACHHHQSPSNQYSYYKFKLIRDNYSIIIVTLYISNVRYTCLYIITRYHSSYQIQTIIYITSKFVRKLNKNY